MLERLKWPGLALILGGAAALVRRWQMATAFEETLNLHRPGAVASWAMVAFFVMAAAIFLLLALREPSRLNVKGRMACWDCAFASERDGVYLTAMVLAGLLSLAAAPFLFQEASELMAIRKANNGQGESGLLQVVLALCTIPSCLALIVSARNAYRMTGRSRENPVLLLPVLLSCLWLLEGYRANAADPVLWHYTPLLMAVGRGMLFSLDCAGLAFGAGRPRRVLWLAAMTVVMSAVALASQPGEAMMALLGGQLFAALAALWVVPGNLRNPPAADRFGLRARLRQGRPVSEHDENTEEGLEDADEAQEIQEEDTHV
jgi:hypothetical protein